MTYSIVARDAATGQLGVAVQTCMFAVGTIVPWARPGIGAVATQSFAEKAYGPRCLDALAEGRSAGEALAAAIAADQNPAVRQVGLVAADGSTAVHTGAACTDHAGDLAGEGFTVQANMMADPGVWPAMAEAYQGAAGSFPHRLLAALDAAQAAGGDARGVMSAAMVIVDAEPGPEWTGRLLDLRVDRSSDPLGDLRRLLGAREAYDTYSRAVDALTGGDPATALSLVDDALATLPAEENLQFIRAAALFAGGDVPAGRRELRSLLARRPDWAVIVRSFAANGLLRLPESVSVESLLA